MDVTGNEDARGRSRSALRWTRRQLLIGAGALAGGALWPWRLRAEGGFELSAETRAALGESPLVYVSPLHPDGSESRCHGEVWFFVDEGGVVVFTAADRWKARAIRRGRDSARLWVGAFGPVKRAGARYRKAPTFHARASLDSRPEVFARLMESFSSRYADEWEKWGPRFQKGWDDGSRVLIRYTPQGA